MQDTFAPFARPLYVMLKPIGAACNLRCTYCYYLEKSHLYGPGSMPRIDDVFQPDGLGHLRCHHNLLARPVYELEVDFGEHDGEWDAGETAPCAEVEHVGAWLEADELGYSERMENVMLIKIVDVLAGYDVDFRVPVSIQVEESGELAALLLAQIREIFQDLIH